MGWLPALSECEAHGEPCVLATVVRVEGSTPRDSGAKMLVRETAIAGTIGGGHLEFSVVEAARELLAADARCIQFRRFKLGPMLGQCCGGVVVVLLEPMGFRAMSLALFGAGHVARALVPLLATLPCVGRWVDSRANEFPTSVYPRIRAIVDDEPLDHVKAMPAG